MATSGIATKEYRHFSFEVSKQAAATGRPFKATIELTYGCNLRCVHCFTDCYNQRDLIRERELPTGEVIRILDQLSDEGVLWLCFTGGEIFVRRDWRQIYAHAKRLGFLITLFTNATLFTEEIVRYLAEYPPFSIETSCHGATEETFDRVTQVPGSFRRFVEGVRLLRAYGLPVRVKTKAMTVNKHELNQLKAFVEGLGLRFKVSTTIYPRLNGDLTPCEYRLSPDEALAVTERFAEACEHEECAATSSAWEPAPPPDDRLYRCGCGTTTLHINAWGELGTCTWVGEPRAGLRENSVAQAVDAVFPRIRAARYLSDSPCRSCQVYRLCAKMPPTAWAESGDPEKPVEHFCQVAFKRAERIESRRKSQGGVSHGSDDS